MPSNVPFVRALYENFAGGNVDAVLAAMAPDIAWREAEGFLFADGNPYVGPGTVASGVFRRCVTEVSDFRVNPQNFIDGGDTVVVEGRYTGTWQKTGRSLNAQFAHLWTLKNGKVVRFQQYTDTHQWTVAAGV